MSLRPKPEVENLKPCPHGGINYAELRALGLTGEKVLDFSVCSNPFMPPPRLKEILSTIPIEQYPDPEATEFVQRLSDKLGIARDNILAGSGAVELIRLIALTYFSRGEAVVILEPTFGEYEIACRIVGAKPVKHWMKAVDDFTPKIDKAANLIKRRRPRGVFICNPNNPTGRYLSRQEIETVLAGGEDTLFILDEAYINFVDHSWSALDLIGRRNVIIIRSMTKDCGLAGLRLGYAIASPVIIDSLRRVRPPWSVNTVAQRAGVIALEDMDYLEQSQKKIKEAKQFLIGELCRLGLQPLPSDTHFFLVRVDNARVMRAALLEKGILVRDCASFGLPEYVRISPRPIPECRRLIDAIGELKKEGELDGSI